MLDVTGVLKAFGLDTTTLVVRKVVASIELAVRVTTLLVDPDTVKFASPKSAVPSVKSVPLIDHW